MQTGLERLLAEPRRWLGGERAGLIANPTTVDRSFHHAIDLLHSHPDVDLRMLFGPEHGIRGDAQYMVEVGDTADPATGLPEISLYGSTFDSLSPKKEHLAEIDTLIFDIQDVGARYYTYAATMALCMRAAAQSSVKVLVLDRPNPIGGVQIEGGGLQAGLENFCGLYPVPQRHAMTVGELARLYNDAFDIGCELDVVACQGWARGQYFDTTGLPWIMPSPNMPTLDTAVVYPGMCLLEGTNVSEGRGTTRPFEIFGAPFVEPRLLIAELEAAEIPGAHFRPCSFEPTFDKFAGERCHGLQIHVTERRTYPSYQAGLAILSALHKLWPDDFCWRTEPYEYRDDVPAIDLLTGTPAVRKGIDSGAETAEVIAMACRGTEVYDEHRPTALLYTE